MIRRLGPVTPAAELAGRLNAAGLATGHGRPFDVKAVQWIRHAYHIPAPAAYADGEITVAEAASRLGCSTGVDLPLDPYRAADRPPQLRQPALHPVGRPGPGRLPGADRRVRPPGPRCPPAHAARPAISRRRRRGQRHRSRLPARLQHHVIYYWIETGKLAACRGPGDRLHIPWNDQVQAECRARIEQSGHLNPAARKTKPRRRH